MRLIQFLTIDAGVDGGNDFLHRIHQAMNPLGDERHPAALLKVISRGR
jgi:hypothetical protein